MSFLNEPGDLARTPLAAILLEALNQRVTGVLAVLHEGSTSRLFIKEGRPVGAQVVSGVKPLGQVLLQAGLIDIDALSRSLDAMAATHRPQGEILVELGAVTREQVDQALAEQQAAYFNLIAALERGRYAFDPATPVPPWTTHSQLSPLRTIVDALERPQAGALVVSALQPVSSDPVRLSSGYGGVAAAFRWTPEEQVLLGRLRTPTTLEAFFAPSGVPPERARAMLAGLLLLGLAVGSGAPARSTGDTGLDLELGASVRAGAGPARRSDPAEARARRQKLLQQAMRNMGIGPFSGPRPPSSAPPGTPAPGAQAASSAPPAQPPKAPAQSSVEQGVRKALLEAAPRAKEPNFFLRLGLSPSASREEVKQAFLSLARKFHPDRFASPALADLSETVKEFFTAVNEAYETLADDKKRAAYLAQRGAAGVVQPEVAKIDFTKGDACLRTRDWARARSFFEAAIRADPRAEYKAALALAILADPTAARDRDRARVLAEEAVRDPSCDRAAYVAGIVARDDKDPSTAERHFRAALVLNPRNADAVRELRLLGRKVR